jgi:hypothetical protein
LDTLYWQRTPQGQIPVTKDGRPLTPEEYDALEADWVGREQRIQSNTRQLAAEREQAAAQRAAQSQAEFNAGAGGVPWTATEMASGLSGAPRSDIPLDAELPIRQLKPQPVNLGENAQDYGWTQVDSGEMERDPETGAPRRAGAWAVAAPAQGPDFIPVDEAGMDAMLAEPDAVHAPNARRRPDLERAGWQPVKKTTPDGKAVWVYSTRDQGEFEDSRARDEARRGVNGRQLSEGMSGGTEYQRRARIKRFADKMGVSEAEAEKMMAEGGESPRGVDPDTVRGVGYNSMAAFDPLRKRADDMARQEKAARAKAAHDAIVRNAQMRQRPMEFLNNPTVSEDARRQMQYQLAGGGPTPNAITMAGELQFMDGIKAGARQNLNVTDPALQRELLEQQRRKDDPSAAGAADLRSGKPMSPQAIDEIDRLAETMDTSPFGFSYDDERRLAVTLQEQYGLSQAEAEAAANRAANKKRWIWSQTKPEDARGVPKPPPPASSDPGVRAWTSGRV